MRDLASALKVTREQSLYRQRIVNQSPAGSELTVDGKQLLNFCSNDYLGLANDPRLREACKRAVDKYGVGSGASQLISGYQGVHHDLELALADFLERPRALLFSTGYMANLGVITSLMKRGDQVFEDRLNHASLIDGARMSDARLHRYTHKSIEALRILDEKYPAQQRLLVSDAVFSMDGDLVNLIALSNYARNSNLDLMIDDAHGLGVLGRQGRGSLSHAGLEGDLACKSVPILVGTFGKAFGTFGAFVAADEDVIETLIQSARSFIYTTAPPAAIAAATLEALSIIQNEEWRREKLSALVKRLQAGLAQLGILHDNSPSAIQPIITGSAESSRMLSVKLRQRGFLISAIRPPTVPDNTSRLRITLSSLHTESQVDQLLSALDDIDFADAPHDG